MAGDWIKFQCSTPDKPEVFDMAETLGIDPDAVVGKLARVWIWADQNCNAGNVTCVTLLKQLDRITAVTGFGEAMQSVGWLVKTETGWSFPNFERHNGQPAKSRALTKNRVASHRVKKCNAPTVTTVTLEPLPEKRREEYKERERAWTLREVKSAGDTAGVPPECCQDYFDAREAAGWVRGYNQAPVKNMPSDLKIFHKEWVDRRQKRNGKQAADTQPFKPGMAI